MESLKLLPRFLTKVAAASAPLAAEPFGRSVRSALPFKLLAMPAQLLSCLGRACNGHVNFVKHLYYIPRIIGSYVSNAEPTKTTTQ